MDSQPHGFEELRDRILKLEKQNRRIKQLGAAALVVFASLLGMGQAPSKKTIEANEFILRDGSGNMRARLSVDEATSGAAQLVLFGTDGGKRIVLDSGIANVYGGLLSLTDDQGRDRVVLGSNHSSGGVLSLLDEKGVSLTWLHGGHVQTNQFDLPDGSGNIRASLFMTTNSTGNITAPGMAKPLPVTFNPSPTLALYDEKGQTKATLDDGHITFNNPQGHLGGALGGGVLLVAGDGGSGAVVAPGIVSTYDEQGFSAVLGRTGLETPRTGETQKTSAASLVLFDKEKHVIWKAP